MGSVETRFGNREQLQRSIAIAHACGLDVYIDVVLHQLIGGNNGVYRYLGADDVRDIGRFPKNPGCFRGASPRRPEDPVPVPADDFPFGDELIYVNCEPPGYTINGMTDFGDLLPRSLDCQGYRMGRHEGNGGHLCQTLDEQQGNGGAFLRQRVFRRQSAKPFLVGRRGR
jgi:alpha-amylase